jgi:hypothetical protein
VLFFCRHAAAEHHKTEEKSQAEVLSNAISYAISYIYEIEKECTCVYFWFCLDCVELCASRCVEFNSVSKTQKLLKSRRSAVVEARND